MLQGADGLLAWPEALRELDAQLLEMGAALAGEEINCLGRAGPSGAGRPPLGDIAIGHERADTNETPRHTAGDASGAG